MMRDNYLCVRCGNPAEEVHHVKRLTSLTVGDPEIALNLDNLESLCRTCHIDEHRKERTEGTKTFNAVAHARCEVLEGYVFDEHGQMIPAPPIQNQ